MAVKAFVLIETATGKSSEVCTALEGMVCVRSAIPVCGPWDVIVVAEGETRGDLGDLVMHRIKPVKGITRTMTCLVTSEAQECGVSISDIVAGFLPSPCVARR